MQFSERLLILASKLNYQDMHYDLVKNILFLDLETASHQQHFEELNERFSELWKKKSAFLRKDSAPGEVYPEKAAIYAEFGKIICIGLGFFAQEEGELVFKTRVLKQANEEEILREFASLLGKLGPKNWRLCAHNGKEFDFPYLCRRMLINRIPLPGLLQLMGRRPWEISHLLDTMEMWKFGDYKAFTSLDLMAACLEVPGSKDDINGSQVGHVYHQDKDLERIARYCQKDVATMAMVFMRLSGLEILPEERIRHEDSSPNEGVY
jgi:DNA polymerase elongation subunit (family B)